MKELEYVHAEGIHNQRTRDLKQCQCHIASPPYHRNNLIQRNDDYFRKYHNIGDSMGITYLNLYLEVILLN